MGQAIRNPETQGTGVKCWALELSSQCQLASLPLAVEGEGNIALDLVGTTTAFPIFFWTVLKIGGII